MSPFPLLALCLVVLVPRCEALVEEMPLRPHTVWTGTVTANSSLQDKAQYKFFPSQCPTGPANACCPNDCGSSLGRGNCVAVTLDSSVCDLLAIDALGWFWATTGMDMTCKCEVGWGGIDCMSCDYGWTGSNCDQRAAPVVRRDFSTLNSTEQQRVVLAFQLVRNLPAPFEPSMSWWDFLVQMHYWATNTPFNGNNVHYAHSGQGFPTWHRRYMRDMEFALQTALGDPTFALPYWNWTTTSLHISENGLANGAAEEPVLVAFGGTGVYSPQCYVVNTSLSYLGDCPVLSGPFANWPTYDPTESYTGVNWCPFGNLTRNFGLLPGNLPSTANVDYALQQGLFAVAPFNSQYYEGKIRQSFEAALEGNYPDATQKMADGQSMHDSVHDWCGGSMSWLLTAANDPLFYMHHAFIDKLLETWIVHWGAEDGLSHLGTVAEEAPVGHGRDECQGPFYPLKKHSYWFNTSENFGYVYDFIPPVSVTLDEEEESSTTIIKGGIEDVTAGAAVFYAAMGAILMGFVLSGSFYKYHRSVVAKSGYEIPLEKTGNQPTSTGSPSISVPEAKV